MVGRSPLYAASSHASSMCGGVFAMGSGGGKVAACKGSRRKSSRRRWVAVWFIRIDSFVCG